MSEHRVPFDPRRQPERQGQRRHLYLTGMAIGIPTDVFKVNRPHTFCNICGAVFQSELDRDLADDAEFTTPFLFVLAENRRREWSHLHSQTHSEKEHRNFRESGRFMTPEAAAKLVPYGIIPLSDQLFDEEVDHAARTAPRMPATVPVKE